MVQSFGQITIILIVQSIFGSHCISISNNDTIVPNLDDFRSNLGMIPGLDSLLGNISTTNLQSGNINDIKTEIIQSLSSSSTNPFTIFDTFISQWRTSLPTIIANSGNFTLLQAALLCAVGAMAAGGATLVAEAWYFKSLNDETKRYKELYGHGGHHSRNYELPVSLQYNQPSFLNHHNPYQRSGTVSYKNYNVPAPAYGTPSRILVQTPTAIIPPSRFKAQSLKRSQRRNQRKNRNAGDRLKNLPNGYVNGYSSNSNKNPKPTQTKRNNLGATKRNRRQLGFNYPTVAPRPMYIPQGMIQPGQQIMDNNPLRFLPFYNFLRRQFMVEPGTEEVMNHFYPVQLSQSQIQQKNGKGFSFPPLNPNRNMITRTFRRYRKTSKKSN